MEKSKHVLIIGDWVVDEYWILGRHISDISSHIGFSHYRITGGEDAFVRDLCGAGHIARVLYNLRDGDYFNILGIGQWNHRDTDLISHLIHAKSENTNCRSAKANFFLTPELCDESPDKQGIRLHTLEPSTATVRVIRTYHEGEEGFEQISRVDWKPEETKSTTDFVDRLQSLIPNLPQSSEIKAVVIYDQNKEIISTELVKVLFNKYPEAEWFVKTKDPNAEWIKTISNNIKLFLVGPEITSLESPWERWLINNKIGIQSLKIIQKYGVKNTVLLSDKRELIGRFNSDDECIIGKSKEKITKTNQLGWASALFACLIDVILHLEPGQNITTEHINGALDLADRSVVNLEDLTKKTSLDLSGDLKVLVSEKAEVKSPRMNQTGTWAAEKDKWKYSLTDHGLLGMAGDKPERLEVWRGSPQIPGYIACIDGKKRIIDKIGQSMRAFANREPNKKSLNILLQADPGSGKTFLAKCLAHEFEFPFLNFDITQMVHRDELLDLFDMVATRQVSTKKPILVFVDEINAPLDVEQVYGAFLSPLEEGVYKRQGNAFTLKPSIWIFAGTNINEDNLQHKDKLSDFRSRMSIIESMDYKSLIKDATGPSYIIEQQARLEQVYLAASVIKNNFRDVKDVTYEVLDKFYLEDPASSPSRLITRKVTALRNVQYGHVTRKNWTWDDNWPNDDDGDRPIKLIFEG